MNALALSTQAACFQSLLGGHDAVFDEMTDVATQADALLLDSRQGELLIATFEASLAIGCKVIEHLEEEERGIFPALQASGVSREMICMLERDHSTLRSMIHELGQLDPTSLRAPRKLAHLVHSFVDFFGWHTEREEELALSLRRDSGISFSPRSTEARTESAVRLVDDKR